MGNKSSGGFIFLLQALQKLFKDLGTLRVCGFFVMTCSASEISGFSVMGARQSAVRYPITIGVAVAGEVLDLIQLFCTQNFAAVQIRAVVTELFRNPKVHS